MANNIFNNRGEVATLVVVGLLALVGVATFLTTTLNQDRKTTNTRASESCTFDSGASIPLGQTETDASNAENRVPISSNRYYYDTLGDMSAFRKVDNQEVLGIPAGSGKTDANVQNMMSKMFSYKPSKLTAAYLPPSENDNYILEIPVDNSTTITMPSLGAYNIGGGYVAMVTFAADDRVTLHVGRHEYFTGTKTCKNGSTCSGGYWIYIKGICVDKQIVNAYNGVKAAQEAAGADLNPIQLPMIRPGHIIGKPNSGSVFVGVRDNGQFISIHRDFYWGSAPVKDISSGGSTNPTSPATQLGTPTAGAAATACLTVKPISVDTRIAVDATNTPTSDLVLSGVKINRESSSGEGRVRLGYMNNGSNKTHLFGPNTLGPSEIGAAAYNSVGGFFDTKVFQNGQSIDFVVETLAKGTGDDTCGTQNFTCTFSNNKASCEAKKYQTFLPIVGGGTAPTPTTSSAQTTPGNSTPTPASQTQITPTPAKQAGRTTREIYTGGQVVTVDGKLGIIVEGGSI